MKKTLLLFGFFIIKNLAAQTPYEARMRGFNQRKSLITNSLATNIPLRNIGPSIQSCRVVDVEVNPKDPTHFYVAYASAGLWETKNNGQTFSPIFDNEAAMTIGDIAVNWEKNIIWIGTGENNSSRSSYAGVGVYRSADNGKNWQHTGLGESHHIGRIVLHPTNPEVAWVAVLGHLYTANKERGLYKTTDGGKNWQQTLFVNENTGGIDLVIDDENPDNLYAAMWQRERRAWNFIESGEGTGVYRSRDGGTTWKKMTAPDTDFPNGAGAGRIGLSMYAREGKKVLYAIIDNQEEKNEADKTPEDADKLSKKQVKNLSKEAFLGLNDEKLDDFLKENDFPEKYKAKDIKDFIRSDKYTVSTLIAYLEDANNNLFDTEVKGAEIYRSDDEGRTWKKTHQKPLDGVFFTYGYYFAQIRVAPEDPNRIYIPAMPILRSDDGGKTFKLINKENVHADHHALWCNPNKPGHIINGNDGGINISYDYGENWVKCNAPPVGQFYSVSVDMAKPYNVYGGLQDNGVWYASSKTKLDESWLQDGEYPWKFIMGGDGMQTAIDTRDNKTVYTGYQFGNYSRLNLSDKSEKSITPKHELGERPLRWNWQSPIMLSTHNQDIVYFCSNKVHRSFDKGETFVPISPDLTNGGKKGDVPYGSITTVHESPLKFGLLYAGTDDGNLQVTKDGGDAWKKINNNLPQGLWCSRVQASMHSKSRVYASLNGYRNDDFSPYLFVSDDYGDTWKNISAALPAEPINVIKEDPNNEDLLYVGTDNGLYISLDRGVNFMAMGKDFPAVAVHDLVVHQRDAELVVGTHGRSIYIGSVKELQQLNKDILAKNLYVFDLEKRKYNANWGKAWGYQKYGDIKSPEYAIPIFSNQNSKGKLTIKTDNNLIIKILNIDLAKGLNYINYSLDIDEGVLSDYEKSVNDAIKTRDKEKSKLIKVKKADSGKAYLQPGKYKIAIEGNGAVVEKDLEVLAK
jgi:photosystem II stability/assembly factor-like uncharacterized protein